MLRALATAVKQAQPGETLVVVHAGEATPDGLLFRGEVLEDAKLLAASDEAKNKGVTVLFVLDACYGGGRVDARRRAALEQAISEQRLDVHYRALDDLRADLVTLLTAGQRIVKGQRRKGDLPLPSELLSLVTRLLGEGAGEEAEEELVQLQTRAMNRFVAEVYKRGQGTPLSRRQAAYASLVCDLAQAAQSLLGNRAMLAAIPRFKALVEDPIPSGRVPLTTDPAFVTGRAGALVDTITQMLEAALAQARGR